MTSVSLQNKMDVQDRVFEYERFILDKKKIKLGNK